MHYQPVPWLHVTVQVVGRLKPHTLVLNSGLWRLAYGQPDWPTAAYESIFMAGQAAVAPQVDWQCWRGPYLAVRAYRAFGKQNSVRAGAQQSAYVDCRRHRKPGPRCCTCRAGAASGRQPRTAAMAGWSAAWMPRQ